MTQRWWMSAEDREDAPEAVARRRREFDQLLPADAIGAPGAVTGEGSGAGEGRTTGEGTTRRSFLQLMGFSAAAAGLGGCRAPVREAVPLVDQPAEMTPGEPLWYATTCGGCGAGCALLAKNRDGRVIKVEGRPGADGTGGGTCAVGQASVLALYDRRRYRGPRWLGRQVAWSEIDRQVGRRLAASARAGGGIALVTGATLGPTASAVVRAFLDRYPTARRVAYEPFSTRALRQVHGELTGRRGLPRFRFERARAVVGIDADFLGSWFAPVEHARGWAERRRPGEGMSWHGQFESRLSPTGAVADRRTPVAPSLLGAVAAALWKRLHRRAGRGAGDRPRGSGPAVPGVDPERLEEAADALWRHRGESLVVSGSQDPAVQRVVAGLNLLLGNLGSTVDPDHPSHQSGGDERHLIELVEAMERGEIHALVVRGVDPARDHPLAQRFREALESVSLVVSLAGRPDATSERAHAVCPEPHFLEAWGDAEPVAGRLQLSQPAMAPLWDTREAPASLLAWMEAARDGGAERQPRGEIDWRRRLEQRWRREVLPAPGNGGEAPRRSWHRALHDGGLATTPPVGANGRSNGSPAAGLDRTAFLTRAEAAADEILARSRGEREAPQRETWEVVLYPEVTTRDGRWSDLPWLQEMPDPVSRLTWGNHAALAPADAARLGLETGDEVRLAVGDAAVELPVLVQPGQARGSVAVALGYGPLPGRTEADDPRRRGVDAWPLVGVEGGRFLYRRSGARLEATGRRRQLATTQDHHLLGGRDIVRETSLAAWTEDPSSDNHRPRHLPSLWPERPVPGHEWGMAIDLNACTGCGACVVACQAENNVPVVGPDEVARNREMHWLRIDRYYRGSEDEPETAFQPMLCQHCDHAPCETVCPVLATVHSSDGLNQQVYNRCVGTRYCANNCPYKVRRFNWFNYSDRDRFDNARTDELAAMVLNPDVTVRSRGVMEKCSMCVQRIQRGKLDARDRGRRVADGDIVTACQEACPTGAFVFGDLADPTSEVSAKFENPRFYHVLEELGVRPSVGYLTRVRHRWGEEPGAEDHPEADGGHGEEA